MKKEQFRTNLSCSYTSPSFFSGQKYFRAKQRGFSLIEVILATSVFVLLAATLIGAYLYGQESTVLAGSRARAVFLAEEGLEVVRNIRDENFSNLSSGFYGLAILGDEWSLSGSGPDVTDIFSRSLIISDLDDDTKEIVVTVEWQQNQQRHGIVTVTSRLTNWQEEVEIQIDCSGPPQERPPECNFPGQGGPPGEGPPVDGGPPGGGPPGRQ